MFTPRIDKVIYCYSEPMPAYDSMEGVTFHQGFSEEMISREKLGEGQTLLILDDLCDEIPHRILGRLFTKLSHHRRMYVLY